MKNAQTSVWRQKAKAVITDVLASHCVLIPSSLPIETQKELLRYIRDAYPFGPKNIGLTPYGDKKCEKPSA